MRSSSLSVLARRASLWLAVCAMAGAAASAAAAYPDHPITLVVT